MIELVEKDGQWSVKPFIPLMESAEAITRVAKGDYLVVTTSQLLRVSLNKEVRVLIPDGGWGGLYPNSVAVDKHGDVYIGMRQFVIRCKLGTRVVSFERLVPDRSWLNTKTQ
jgi:S-formylglutathione hydrolase FrmB